MDQTLQGKSSRAHEVTYLEAGPPTYQFMAYNIVMIMVSSWLLILFLVKSVYLPTSQFQAARVGEAAQSATNASPGAGGAPSANLPPMQIQAAMVGEAAQSGTNASPGAGSTPTVVPGQAANAQANRSGNALSDAGQAALLFTLLTMLAAGCAGGTLCNLRGIFKYYRDEGGLPQKFVVPFIIRPVMGAAAGLLAFFVAAFFSGALSGPATDAATLGWATLGGRLPFVALAILAGFGSQEFMERMKEVAKTTFADSPKEGKPMKIVETAGWTEKDGPETLAPAGADELVVVYGNLNGRVDNSKPFEWNIYYPDEAIPRPPGPATAVKITGRTLDERKAVAEQMIQRIVKEKSETDWRQLKAEY